MPRGGKRQGAGRKPGSVTKRTREIAEGAAKAGTGPLEFVLSIANDPEAPLHVRASMAVAALPFCHPKLSSVTLDANSSVGLVSEVHIHSVPSHFFLTQKQVNHLAAHNELKPAMFFDPLVINDDDVKPNAPVTIEHEPQQDVVEQPSSSVIQYIPLPPRSKKV